MSRQKLSTSIHQRQVTENDDEVYRLNQAVTGLLLMTPGPNERAALEAEADKTLQPPVRRHYFSHDKINTMLDAYYAIQNRVKNAFLREFGDKVSDPLLQRELISQVCRISLEALRGKLTDDTEIWQTLVDKTLKMELAPYRQSRSEND